MEEFKTNLNHYIKFKINKNLSEHLVKMPPLASGPNKEGYYTMQLWEFCSYFGLYMANTCDPVVDPNVMILNQ